MTGVVLRNYAREQCLKQADGVIYGVIDGYITTISEISGGKQLSIGISGVREETLDILRKELGTPEHAKGFQMAGYEVNEFFVTVILLDQTASMYYVREFRKWIYPILQEYGAKGADTCPVCGQPLQNDRVYYLINGRAYVFHRSCSRRISVQVRIHNELKRMQTGHYTAGFIGSLTAGLVGALPLGMLYACGWFSGWIGLIIAYFTQVGYIRLGGRLKRVSAFLMSLAAVISVFCGVVLGEFIRFGIVFSGGRLSQFLLEIPDALKWFTLNFHITREILATIIIGILFAGIGFVQLFFRIYQQESAILAEVKNEK